MPVPREWHHEIELGAVLDLGTDGHRPSDEAGPLLDADEAEAAAVACLRYREPAAIVGDAQLDGGAAAGQRHVHAMRARMPDHVAQGLLGHSVQAQRHVGGDDARAGVGMEDHLRPLCALHLVTVPAQGGDEARLLEGTGVQLVREVAHTLRDITEHRAQPAELHAGAPWGAAPTTSGTTASDRMPSCASASWSTDPAPPPSGE